MRSAETRRRARRGLLALLDGLVIAVLAAVITARSNGTDVSDLVGATVGVLSTWVGTPGVGTMEAIAYAGFAVAAIGPLWFWVVRSVVGPVRVESLLPSRASGPADLDPSREASPVDRRNERGQISDGGAVFRTVLADDGESSGPDWTEDVFGESSTPTMAVPEGDFLRGGSGADPEGSDHGERRDVLRATFGPPGDDDTRQSVDISESSSVGSEPDRGTQSAIEVAIGVDPGEEPTPAETEPDEGPLEAIDDRETETEGVESDVAAYAEASAGDPAHPLDRLGEQLSDSRAHIGAVEDRLADASAPNGVETAKTALAARTGGVDDTARQLEDELSNRTLRVAEAIAEIRTDQETIESAFEAASR